MNISNIDFEKLVQEVAPLYDKLELTNLESIIRHYFPDYESFITNVNDVIDVLIGFGAVKENIKSPLIMGYKGTAIFKAGEVYVPYVPYVPFFPDELLKDSE